MQLLSVHKEEPKEGEVSIAIKSVALNDLDLITLRGLPDFVYRYLPTGKLTLPHVLGTDGAGVIDKVGKNVKGFSVGDRVVIYPGINRFSDKYTERGEHSLSPGYMMLGKELPGTLRERVCVSYNNILKLPEHCSFDEAVAWGISGFSSYKLIRLSQIKPENTILVMGASGGAAYALL